MTRPPWHHRPGAILTIALYALLALLVAALHTDLLLGAFNRAERAWLAAIPLCLGLAFALAAASGLAGGLLLLVRAPLAALLTGIAFLALLAATLWSMLALSPPLQDGLSPQVALILAALTGLAALAWLHARSLHRAGVTG